MTGGPRRAPAQRSAAAALPDVAPLPKQRLREPAKLRSVTVRLVTPLSSVG